jgi:hypothetical protein
MRAAAQQPLDVERLTLGGQQVALVEPQGLEVLDQAVEELDIQAADLIDQRGVFLGDEVDQGLDRQCGLGRFPAEQVDRLGQDRSTRLVAF